MKCDGCGKEIIGQSYCTHHYDGVQDESGNDLMVEDHGPCLTFGTCCVVRTQDNGYGFYDIVLKDHIWPYKYNRWGEPLKFLSDEEKVKRVKQLEDEVLAIEMMRKTKITVSPLPK